MKIALFVDKNEAMMAGKDVFGWQVVEVSAGDLTEDQRALIVRNNATWISDPNNDFALTKEKYKISRAGPEGLADAIHQIKDAEELEKKRIDNDLVEKIEYTKTRLRDFIDDKQQNPYSMPYNELCEKPHPEIKELLDAAIQERDARIDKMRADDLAKDMIREANEREKEEQFSDLVMNLGTDEQKSRFVDGLLPKVEGWGLLEAKTDLDLRACLDGIPFYREDVPIFASSYCDVCDSSDLEEDSKPLSSLCPREYSDLLKIRAALPANAKIVFRNLITKCSGCHSSLGATTCAEATWRIKQYTVVRRFRLGYPGLGETKGDK